METSTLPQSASGNYAPAAGRLHTTFLLAILMAWAFLGRIMVGRMQTAANPHRMRFYMLTLAFEWLVFAYVIAGVRRNGQPAQIVWGTRWRSFGQFARDIGIAAAFWIIAAALLFIVAELLHVEAARQNLQFLLPQGALELALWIALSISAGICEETIFRGYLQRQFMAFTRSAPAGILLSAAAFGAGHAYQGSRMMILIGVYGVLFGILAHWRGSVRPGMIAHAWQDSLDGLIAVIKLR
jgi:membrane protease YdiL (CAAX protease family)